MLIGTKLVVDIIKHGAKLKLGIADANVAILYPSLCCPLIHIQGAPLSIIIGVDDIFDRYYRENYSIWDEVKASLHLDVDDDRSDWNTPVPVRQHIGKFIKIKPWNKAVYTGKVAETEADKPYFTPDQAIKSIACIQLDFDDGKLFYYPYDATQGKHTNKIHYANFREDTLTFYRQQGIKHFYQIDLYDVTIPAGDLYEISWISRDDKAYLNNKLYLEKQDLNLQKFYLEKALFRKGR